MTDAEMLQELRNVTDSRDDERILLSFLASAKRRILNRMYPYAQNYSDLKVPEKYQSIQIEVAAFLMNKRGAEGEVQHNENGVSRTYGGADVPPSMLAEITPMCALPE